MYKIHEVIEESDFVTTIADKQNQKIHYVFGKLQIGDKETDKLQDTFLIIIDITKSSWLEHLHSLPLEVFGSMLHYKYMNLAREFVTKFCAERNLNKPISIGAVFPEQRYITSRKVELEE